MMATRMQPIADLECPCGAILKAGSKIGASGWLNKEWPTIGGGFIRVVCCFKCRRLVVLHEGSDRCNGRCGGAIDNQLAARSDCLDCQDGSALEERPPSRAIPGVNFWSCMDDGCVKAWADEHRHGWGHIEITPGRAA